MQRFILQSNIRRFEDALREETDTRCRAGLQDMLALARRELALLNVAESGVRTVPAPLCGRPDRADDLRRCFRQALDASSEARLILDLGPGLHIVDVSDVYAETTMVQRACVAGEALFDVFPENPREPTADGASKVYESLRRVVETRRPDAMPVQRYDVRDLEGRFVERYWRTLNSPLFDDRGRLACILSRVVDVTAQVLGGPLARAF